MGRSFLYVAGLYVVGRSMSFRTSVPMSAVVFGGNGFIGRYVVREMARRGWRVVVASRDPEGSLFLKTSGQIGEITPLFANIRDDASVRAAMRGADVVVNLVGILYETRRQTFDAVHSKAAGRLARIAAELGVSRMVHVSAIGADEKALAQYARSKAAGEAAVLQAFPGASILRPSIIFGPEDNFFNLFASLSRIAPFLPLIGGGKTRFQPVYVGDVADAVMAVLDRPESAGERYELGGPRIYTFKELMALMQRETRIKRPMISIPWAIASLKAFFLSLAPKPLLTPDQVKLLKSDNVVSQGALGLADLGIEPTAAEIILPTYLHRFRPGGRFAPETI